MNELFEKMLCGQATTIEMSAMANLYLEKGIAILQLSEDQLSKVPVMGKTTNADTSYWPRYGSPNKPIFSYPIAGELGAQGAVIISSAEGESCDISQFDDYLGPPHYHHNVTHITAVLHGTGVFLIAGETKSGKYLVKVPVKRGDIALIPANVIHTFFTNHSMFEVVSFTDKLIPTDSPEFLVLASADEINSRPFIDYHDFLEMRNAQ